MFDYLRNIEEKHFNEEDHLSSSEFSDIFDLSIKFHTLKLLIVPFCQRIVSDEMLQLMYADVMFSVAILWFPVFMAFEDNRTLMGSLAGFFCGLLASSFFMACVAIDLCFNLIVLFLSPITRSLATIVHMLFYAPSGADATQSASNTPPMIY